MRVEVKKVVVEVVAMEVVKAVLTTEAAMVVAERRRLWRLSLLPRCLPRLALRPSPPLLSTKARCFRIINGCRT